MLQAFFQVFSQYNSTSKHVIVATRSRTRKSRTSQVYPGEVARHIGGRGMRCAAESVDIISRSAQISRYISALPQYRKRFAVRYTNPLRDTLFFKKPQIKKRASGFEFVRSTNKKKQAPTSECLYKYGNFSRAEYTCTRHWRKSSPMASFGMRTHILKITDFQGGSIPTGSHQQKKDTHKECPFFVESN